MHLQTEKNQIRQLLQELPDLDLLCLLLKYDTSDLNKSTWHESFYTIILLTPDWEAAGSSLTGVTVLWSLSKAHLS